MSVARCFHRPDSAQTREAASRALMRQQSCLLGSAPTALFSERTASDAQQTTESRHESSTATEPDCSNTSGSPNRHEPRRSGRVVSTRRGSSHVDMGTHSAAAAALCRSLTVRVRRLRWRFGSVRLPAVPGSVAAARRSSSGSWYHTRKHTHTHCVCVL